MYFEHNVCVFWAKRLFISPQWFHSTAMVPSRPQYFSAQSFHHFLTAQLFPVLGSGSIWTWVWHPSTSSIFAMKLKLYATIFICTTTSMYIRHTAVDAVIYLRIWLSKGNKSKEASIQIKILKFVLSLVVFHRLFSCSKNLFVALQRTQIDLAKVMSTSLKGGSGPGRNEIGEVPYFCTFRAEYGRML